MWRTILRRSEAGQIRMADLVTEIKLYENAVRGKALEGAGCVLSHAIDRSLWATLNDRSPVTKELRILFEALWRLGLNLDTFVLWATHPVKVVLYTRHPLFETCLRDDHSFRN